MTDARTDKRTDTVSLRTDPSLRRRVSSDPQEGALGADSCACSHSSGAPRAGAAGRAAGAGMGGEALQAAGGARGGHRGPARPPPTPANRVRRPRGRTPTTHLTGREPLTWVGLRPGAGSMHLHTKHHRVRHGRPPCRTRRPRWPPLGTLPENCSKAAAARGASGRAAAASSWRRGPGRGRGRRSGASLGKLPGSAAARSP